MSEKSRATTSITQTRQSSNKRLETSQLTLIAVYYSVVCRKSYRHDRRQWERFQLLLFFCTDDFKRLVLGCFLTRHGCFKPCTGTIALPFPSLPSLVSYHIINAFLCMLADDMHSPCDMQRVDLQIHMKKKATVPLSERPCRSLEHIHVQRTPLSSYECCFQLYRCKQSPSSRLSNFNISGVQPCFGLKANVGRILQGRTFLFGHGSRVLRYDCFHTPSVPCPRPPSQGTDDSIISLNQLRLGVNCA